MEAESAVRGDGIGGEIAIVGLSDGVVAAFRQAVGFEFAWFVGASGVVQGTFVDATAIGWGDGSD